MSNILKMKTIAESVAELNPSRATVNILKCVRPDPTFAGSSDFCQVLSRVLAACNASDEPSFTVVTLLHDYLRNNYLSEAMEVELAQCGYQDALFSLPIKFLSARGRLDDSPPSPHVNTANLNTSTPSYNQMSWIEDLVVILSSPFAVQIVTPSEEVIELLDSVGFDGPDSQLKRAYLRQVVHECSGLVLQNLDVVWVLDSAQERLDKFLELSSLAASFDPDYEFLVLQADRITCFSKQFPYRNLALLLRYLKTIAALGFQSGKNFVQDLENATSNDEDALPNLQFGQTDFETFVARIQEATEGRFFSYAREIRQIEHLVSSGMPEIALTMLDHSSLDTDYPHKKWAASLRVLAESLSFKAIHCTRSAQNIRKINDFSLSRSVTIVDDFLPLQRLEAILDIISKISVLNRDDLSKMASEVYALETEVIKEVERADDFHLDLLGRLLILIQCGRIIDQRLTVRCVRMIRRIIENTAGSLSQEIVQRLALLEVEALYSLGRDREVCECVSSTLERKGSRFGNYQEEDAGLLSYLLRSIINMDAESQLERFVQLKPIENFLMTRAIHTDDRTEIALACLRIHVVLGNSIKAKALIDLLLQWSENKPKDQKLLHAVILAGAFFNTLNK